MSCDVAYVLKEFEKQVTVEDEGKFVVVHTKGYIKQWRDVNELLKENFNAEWISLGKQSHWRIPLANIMHPETAKQCPIPLPSEVEQTVNNIVDAQSTVLVMKPKEVEIKEAIQKVKQILQQLHLNTFNKYREAGLEIIKSGYKKGKWHSEDKKKALKEWAIGNTTFSYIVQFGQMTNKEFFNNVEKFPSIHAWANRPQEKREIPPLPKGPFDIIYADPPWKYEINYLSGAAEKHYQTMTVEEICNLKVPISQNTILFLWATNPMLENALQVIKAWGFSYKTNLAWIKNKFGTGFYVRGQHELLLIGIRGDVHPPEQSNRPPSILKALVREHSQKPDEVYDIIEKMYPDARFLELFARQKREGWEVWGNEV